MKKVLITFIMMLIALCAGITTVQAASFDVTITPKATEIKRGDTVDVTVAVKNLSFDATRGLVGFTANLEYDKTVFNELTVGEGYVAEDFSAGKGWGFPNYQPADNSVACTYGGWLTKDNDVFTVTFKVKDAAKLGSTTIALKNVKGTDGEIEVAASNVSTVLTIKEKETTPAPGDGGNTTPPPTTTVKPTVTVSQEKVTNGIKVTLTSNKELATTAGWTLSSDKKQLSRVYTADFAGTITIKDANGIESDPIKLDVKLGTPETPNNPGNNEKPGTTEDKTAPTATVKYAKGTKGVTVTVVANEELKPLDGWTLSADKKTLTKLYTADFSGTITIQDLAGNKSAAIKIDVDVDGKDGNGAGSGNNNNNDNGGGSQSKDPLPKTGARYIVPVIALVAIIGTGAFIRYKSMEY